MRWRGRRESSNIEDVRDGDEMPVVADSEFQVDWAEAAEAVAAVAGVDQSDGRREVVLARLSSSLWRFLCSNRVGSIPSIC